MFSLQKLLGKEDKLFGLLEASAEEARTSVQSLVKLEKALKDKPLIVDEFARLRQVDKKITEEISQVVYTSFVTALDREDIEELSNVLYKIPKIVHKFTERLLISPPEVLRINFSGQIMILEQTTDVVVHLVRSLRKEDLGRIRDLNKKLQELENRADEQLVELYRDLFSGAHPPLDAIALKDLYDQLEKVIDRCNDAGKAIARIALKNS
jgi:uncharacterized protein Yka (UPF0111/DUF47 family)